MPNFLGFITTKENDEAINATKHLDLKPYNSYKHINYEYTKLNDQYYAPTLYQKSYEIAQLITQIQSKNSIELPSLLIQRKLFINGVVSKFYDQEHFRQRFFDDTFNLLGSQKTNNLLINSHPPLNYIIELIILNANVQSLPKMYSTNKKFNQFHQSINNNLKFETETFLNQSNQVFVINE